jgi:hypothetical protein
MVSGTPAWMRCASHMIGVARHAHAAVGCGSPHRAADVLDAVLPAVRRA